MSDIMALIARASWREAVTYRHTWPHEYVLMNKDQQHDLIAGFRERIARGEGVECQFFHQKKQYLFLGNHKYWTEGGFDDDELVLNRALLYRDRRDFLIQEGDSGLHVPQGASDPEQSEDSIQVNVREMWENEATRFTPWLAEEDNLNQLGSELGLSLKLVQTEKAIGTLSLDILAQDSSDGTMVAIENQLEWTDFDHLGRLLAYAAGSGAQILIWVAPEFMYEHAHVLHQLNEWSGSNASFYGVKVEAIKRNPDAGLEPRFRRVVYPGGWNREISLPQETVQPHIQRYRDFFQPLINSLRVSGLGFDVSPRQRFDYMDRLFPSPVNSGFGYMASFWKDYAWVTLHVQMEEIGLTKSLFNALEAEREQIELGISVTDNSEWQWDKNASYSYSSVSLRKRGSIEDSPEQLEDTRKWMLDLLPKLKEVFDPRLAELLSGLER